jgi:hypothetical protein
MKKIVLLFCCINCVDYTPLVLSFLRVSKSNMVQEWDRTLSVLWSQVLELINLNGYCCPSKAAVGANY